MTLLFSVHAHARVPSLPHYYSCVYGQALLEDYEFEFLNTLSDPKRALSTMLLTKLLSTPRSGDAPFLLGLVIVAGGR